MLTEPADDIPADMVAGIDDALDTAADDGELAAG
jgi:hypothetical protein